MPSCVAVILSSYSVCEHTAVEKGGESRTCFRAREWRRSVADFSSLSGYPCMSQAPAPGQTGACPPLGLQVLPQFLSILSLPHRP